MTKREQQLMDELRDRYSCQACNGVHYPRDWMTKTREKMMREGKLMSVPCSLVMPNYIALYLK